MNRMRVVVCGITVCVLLLLFTAPGWTGGESGTAGKKIELTLWDSYHIPPTEQKKSQENWYITGALKRFEQENPGVQVELTVIPDEEQAHQTYKAAALAGNAPDLCQLWPGAPIFPLKDVLLNLEGKVPSEDLENLTGWDYLRYNFDPNAELLAFPTGGVGVTFFMYNKKLVMAAGLDFEAKPPMNASEFDAACEQLKANGIQPIITGESGFERFVYFITNYWWGQLVGGSKGVLKFNSGERTFAEDKSLVEVFTYYKHLYEKGYLNKDAASAGKDALNRFFQGEAAMLPSFTQQLTMAADAMGGFEDIGILFPPDISNQAPIKNSTMGGPGKCFVVAKNSKHPELAIKLASFLSSKDEIARFSEVLPVVSIRRDMTSAEMGLPDEPVFKKLLAFMNAEDRRIVYWVDQVLDQAAMTNIAKLSPLILTGKMTPKELALEVNKAMAER